MWRVRPSSGGRRRASNAGRQRCGAIRVRLLRRATACTTHPPGDEWCARDCCRSCCHHTGASEVHGSGQARHGGGHTTAPGVPVARAFWIRSELCGRIGRAGRCAVGSDRRRRPASPRGAHHFRCGGGGHMASPSLPHGSDRLRAGRPVGSRRRAACRGRYGRGLGSDLPCHPIRCRPGRRCRRRCPTCVCRPRQNSGSVKSSGQRTGSRRRTGDMRA